ncbi:MAG: hypothetical protein JWQ25_1185 [Daejeonella sp.]|nr:hypothetical protein [Daejeonella sp.]
MQTTVKQRELRMKQVIATYNMLPNLIWSILALVPLVIFCNQFMSLKSILISVGVSQLPALLPNSFYSGITFIDKPQFLTKIGLSFFNHFTQSGTLINKLIRKKYPDYKVISINRNSIKKIISQTYMFERFHAVMFTFFAITVIYAFMEAEWFWVLMLVLLNILYNVYPILLQHAIRMRLSFKSKTY